jgi:hypothetical protein
VNNSAQVKKIVVNEDLCFILVDDWRKAGGDCLGTITGGVGSFLDGA